MVVIRLSLLVLIFLQCSNAIAGSVFPVHTGTAPTSFTRIAEPSDTFIVVDTGPLLDTPMRSIDGQIIINIPIRRYVGKTNPQGYLDNVDQLVANGIVSRTARIILPAKDVDFGAPDVSYDCDLDGLDEVLTGGEIDDVYFNLEKIGVLRGYDSRWHNNVFYVDISKVKFPSEPGNTAINSFVVDIDVANKNLVTSSGQIGCSFWQTSVDWVALEFKAASPVVLVHGINSQGSVFGSFEHGLSNRYIASESIIKLDPQVAPDPLPPGCPDIPYNRSIQNNVNLLRALNPQSPDRNSITSIAKLYGTDSVHLVTHSKGGLDSRGFIHSLNTSPLQIPLGYSMGTTGIESDLEVMSLVTLNTPHEGSVLADYGVQARQLDLLERTRAGAYVYLSHKFEGDYYCDLTPTRAAAFVQATYLPSHVNTASVATDADLDGDGEITAPNSNGVDEGAGFDMNERITDLTKMANILYQLVGEIDSVLVTVTPDFPWDDVDVVPTNNTLFRLNDVIVTQKSAGLYNLYTIDDAHHLNVHSQENAEEIADDAQSGSGLVNWRLR